MFFGQIRCNGFPKSSVRSSFQPDLVEKQKMSTPADLTSCLWIEMIFMKSFLSQTQTILSGMDMTDLKAHLTLEGLHRRMYMRVLFQPRWGGESLPALWTGVWPGAHVVLPDVPLQITWISEYLQKISQNGWLSIKHAFCGWLPLCNFHSGTFCAPREQRFDVWSNKACRSKPLGNIHSGGHLSCGCASRSNVRPIYGHKTHYFKQQS